MRMITRSVLISPVLIAVIASSFASAQSTSSSTHSNQTTDDERHEIGNTSNKVKPKAAATPDPAPELDFWHQETMTGDWGGARSRWKEKGVELEFEYVGIFQSIASGGTDDKSSLTNKLETRWKFDLAKVAGWKFWSSEIKAEWRFGGPALTGTGGINFTNTAGIIPGARGSVVSVTAVNFTADHPERSEKGRSLRRFIRSLQPFGPSGGRILRGRWR